jgi:hypothetical protein
VSHEEHSDRVGDVEHSVQGGKFLSCELEVQVLRNRVRDNSIDLRDRPVQGEGRALESLFERAGRKTHIFLQVEACVGDERHEKDTALLPRGVARAEKGVPTLHRVVNTLW